MGRSGPSPSTAIPTSRCGCRARSGLLRSAQVRMAACLRSMVRRGLCYNTSAADSAARFWMITCPNLPTDQSRPGTCLRRGQPSCGFLLGSGHGWSAGDRHTGQGGPVRRLHLDDTTACCPRGRQHHPILRCLGWRHAHVRRVAQGCCCSGSLARGVACALFSCPEPGSGRQWCARAATSVLLLVLPSRRSCGRSCGRSR